MEGPGHGQGDDAPDRTSDASVCLVVINYGNQHLTANLLSSLATHPDRRLIQEAVIVDNGFPDNGDARALVSPSIVPFPVRFVQYHGHSYSGSINLAADGCSSPVLLLCNNDLEWLPGYSIEPAVAELLRHPEIGIAGPQLVFPDGRWQRSAADFPSVLEGLATLCFLGVLRNRIAAARFKRGIQPVEAVDYVDGACVAVSRRCFDALKGWDPAFEFYACDTDFNWRAKQAGWKRVLVPAARVMHVRGASSSGKLKRAYAGRLFAAKRRMVERMHGRGLAACYDVLQRIAAIEYAIAFGIAGLIWRTPAANRRATAAWESCRAAFES
jgi:N-acetylglucosaminyl-diphospho-decaprenol L-rhamnosyltransferase